MNEAKQIFLFGRIRQPLDEILNAISDREMGRITEAVCRERIETNQEKALIALDELKQQLEAK